MRFPKVESFSKSQPLESEQENIYLPTSTLRASAIWWNKAGILEAVQVQVQRQQPRQQQQR